jgi:hypothetical protein
MVLRLCAFLILSSIVACSQSSDSEPVVEPGPDSGSGVERMIFEIDSQKVPCTGVGPMECLRIREPGEVEWRFFYDSIEGFTFEPGFRYVVEVDRTRVENPPADASSFRYRLVELVSKDPEA